MAKRSKKAHFRLVIKGELLDGYIERSTIRLDLDDEEWDEDGWLWIGSNAFAVSEYADEFFTFT